MNGLGWSIILLLAALGVIGIEMFVPSAGLLAVLSGVLIISSLIVAFLHSVTAGVAMVIAVAVLLPFIFLVFVHVWPNTPIGKRVLLGTIDEDDVKLKGEHYDGQQDLVGKIGIAKSKMIPSGQIVIDGRKHDAVSEGLPIEAGEPIKVVAIRMFKIIVRKSEAGETVSSNLEEDILSQPIDDVFE